MRFVTVKDVSTAIFDATNTPDTQGQIKGETHWVDNKDKMTLHYRAGTQQAADLAAAADRQSGYEVEVF